MVVLAIIDQLPRDIQKDLLIVDYFSGAQKVSARLNELNLAECSVWFFADEAKAFSFVRRRRYKKIFIDSDVGFIRNLTLIKLWALCPESRIAVYEEGVGTYRNDLYAGLKKRIMEALGCGVYFGGNWRTSELYLYQPELCQNKLRAQKLPIHKSISSLLVCMANTFEYIFDSADFFEKIMQRNESSRCLIYLSNWQLDKAVVDQLKQMRCLTIVKPHPHIKELGMLNEMEGMVLAPAGIPAEMLISMVSRKFDHVKVLHHGSSVVRYVNYESVEFCTV